MDLCRWCGVGRDRADDRSTSCDDEGRKHKWTRPASPQVVLEPATDGVFRPVYVQGREWGT
jgi:hypothetical protein